MTSKCARLSWKNISSRMKRPIWTRLYLARRLRRLRMSLCRPTREVPLTTNIDKKYLSAYSSNSFTTFADYKNVSIRIFGIASPTGTIETANKGVRNLETGNLGQIMGGWTWYSVSYRARRPEMGAGWRSSFRQPVALRPNSPATHRLFNITTSI